MSGGSARPVIPFLKRTGFLASDGTPTELYNRFRNPGQRGAAAAEAVKKGYAPLYESNEYAHNLSADKLKGLVIQVTGLEEGSNTLGAILGSFKALNGFADHDAAAGGDGAGIDGDIGEERGGDAGRGDSDSVEGGVLGPIRLGYTINLNLPATSDIAVFDAIFKSLRENILKP